MGAIAFAGWVFEVLPCDFVEAIARCSATRFGAARAERVRRRRCPREELRTGLALRPAFRSTCAVIVSEKRRGGGERGDDDDDDDDGDDEQLMEECLALLVRAFEDGATKCPPGQTTTPPPLAPPPQALPTSLQP